MSGNMSVNGSPNNGSPNPIQPEGQNSLSKKLKSKIGRNFTQHIPEKLSKVANRIKGSKVGELFSRTDSPLRRGLTNTKAIIKGSFDKATSKAQSLGSKIGSLEEKAAKKIASLEQKLANKIDSLEEKLAMNTVSQNLEDTQKNREYVKKSVEDSFRYAEVEGINSQLDNLASIKAKSGKLSWDDELTKEVLEDIKASRNKNPDQLDNSPQEISEENVLAKTKELDEARAKPIRAAYAGAPLDELTKAYAEAAGRNDKVKTDVLNNFIQEAKQQIKDKHKNSSEQELDEAINKARASGNKLEADILFELKLEKSTDSIDLDDLISSFSDNPSSAPSRNVEDTDEINTSPLNEVEEEFESIDLDDDQAVEEMLKQRPDFKGSEVERQFSKIEAKVDALNKKGSYSDADVFIKQKILENKGNTAMLEKLKELELRNEGF